SAGVAANPPDHARGEWDPPAREPQAGRAGRQEGLRVRAGPSAAQAEGVQRLYGSAYGVPLIIGCEVIDATLGRKHDGINEGESTMPTLSDGTRNGPFAGILIADLTHALSGPFCTMLLAELGARVVKIERPPAGDVARAFGPLIGGQGAYFANINRGKES